MLTRYKRPLKLKDWAFAIGNLMRGFLTRTAHFVLIFAHHVAAEPEI